MTATKNRLLADLKTAMRERDKSRIGVLRLIQAAIKQQEIDNRIDLSEEQVMDVLNKMAKRYRDAIEQFKNAGRDDLVNKETSEFEIVKNYLPKPLNHAEITTLIQTTISETSTPREPKSMGKIMAILKKKLGPGADLSPISQQLKIFLARE